MPRVCRSSWNLMTWVNPESIYTTKATIRFKRTSRVLLVPFGLGSTSFVLYINPYCTFCAFFVKSGDLLSLFLFTRLWQILFSFSFHCFPTSCMCCLHCSSRRFSDGSYSGFLFCFCCFFALLLENKYALARRGVARDKLVFGVLKHYHVSFWFFFFLHLKFLILEFLFSCILFFILLHFF